MEVNFTNPFAKKRQDLKDAAAGNCKGCGALLSMSPQGTVRKWCSKPKKLECRKMYYKNR